MPLYPPEEVWIEYDSRNKRVIKTFTDHYRAKAFFVAKDRLGKNPRVLNPAKVQRKVKPRADKPRSQTEGETSR